MESVFCGGVFRQFSVLVAVMRPAWYSWKRKEGGRMEEAEKLADYMIGGFFLMGRFRLKRKLTVIYFILFALQNALCYLNILPLFLRLFLPVMLIPGALITFCMLFWLPRAARVSRMVGSLARRGDCGEALRELEETGRRNFAGGEVIFAPRYGFFFPSGAVLSYGDIAALRIQAEYNKPRGVRFLPMRSVLWARLADGKWVPLAYAAGPNRGEATLEPLRKYASELMKRSGAVKLD